MKRARKAPKSAPAKKSSVHAQARVEGAKPATSAAPADSDSPRPRIGSEYTVEAIVPHDWTIQAIDGQLPPVLSTPRMIQMMEHASTRAILDQLPPGAISVGTRIEVDHLKAVPDGATVRAHAKLVGYQGRFLVFDVEAKSGDLVIGRGKVFRAIVESGRHAQKARSRVSGPGGGTA
ncbi:MAG TPA: hotdog domain-containing protein [Candidatus Aquilonibacter sp.]|nr:hotdog domain-containing protein [Candidatus Aquilonibacter sp.]